MIPQAPTNKMIAAAFLARKTLVRLNQIFLASFIALFLIGSVAYAPTAYARPTKKTTSKSPKKSRADSAHQRSLPNPDALISGIYMDLAAGSLRAALTKADKLVEAYPNFRLAHLVRGDLLMMHAHRVTTFGAAPDDAPKDRLQELRAEVMARLKLLHQVPDAGLFPRAFTQLRDDHKYAILIDTRQSRLFLYRNRGGKLGLIHHYYISHGKLGVNKFREGDQKTPLGIYRITGRISAAKLPDFYGAGALPLNYPNDWDKVHGRGGSGIWLHGMPSNSFSRPPLASDGCVALTNPDMSALASTIDAYKTLVVISDRVEMVNAKVLDKDRKLANTLVSNWRRDLEYGNRAYLRRHYADKFRSNANEELKPWFDRQYPPNAREDTTYRMHDISILRYPGYKDMIAVAFRLSVKSGKVNSESRRFQLWEKEGGKWKIVFENTIKDFL